MATHSPDILKQAEPERVLEVKQGGGGSRYLIADRQKVALLAGLGSDYAPRVDQIRRTNRVLFVEGPTDVPILKALAGRLGVAWPGSWIVDRMEIHRWAQREEARVPST